MTLGCMIERSNQILKEKGIQSFSLDTCLLLAHFLHKDKLYVLTHKDEEVADSEGFFELVRRRATFEPIAYIIGVAEFMSIEFNVNKATLIPRPDTETLVEYIIDKIGDEKKSFLDIGTGSGCIAISIAKYCKNSKGTAVDISEEALKTAQRNAEKNSVSDRLNFVKCDILKDTPTGKYDILVSNPPYIETDVIPTLMEDVRDFEPYGALWGGDDGLVFYRRISEISPLLLNEGGILAFEVGQTQSGAVEKLLIENGFENTGALKDLAGIDRVVYGIKKLNE